MGRESSTHELVHAASEVGEVYVGDADEVGGVISAKNSRESRLKAAPGNVANLPEFRAVAGGFQPKRLPLNERAAADFQSAIHSFGIASCTAIMNIIDNDRTRL
jgi:hypothetical protein